MSDITAKGIKKQTSSVPERRELFETASEHGGYFTSDQARACGFSRALLSHHAKSGRFVRIKRGLYRFREYPSSSREHVLAAWLTAGKDVAIVSHESALDILGLSNVVPDAVHLTVPRSKRNLRPIPGVKIHTVTEPPPKGDLLVRDGITITSATRSIVDAAEAGVAPDQIAMAVVQAVQRGLVDGGLLKKRASERGKRVEVLITAAVEKVAQ